MVLMAVGSYSSHSAPSVGEGLFLFVLMVLAIRVGFRWILRPITLLRDLHANKIIEDCGLLTFSTTWGPRKIINVYHLWVDNERVYIWNPHIAMGFEQGRPGCIY